MKAAEIDEKLQRKLCGVGENGANRAKVVFILLTGALALVEAVLITTSTKRSVYIDIGFALETAGQKEILDVFNASAFLPSCTSDRRLRQPATPYPPAAAVAATVVVSGVAADAAIAERPAIDTTLDRKRLRHLRTHQYPDADQPLVFGYRGELVRKRPTFQRRGHR